MSMELVDSAAKTELQIERLQADLKSIKHKEAETAEITLSTSELNRLLSVADKESLA